MAPKNKQVNNSERRASEEVQKNYEFNSNTSDKEVDLDQLNESNLEY